MIMQNVGSRSTNPLLYPGEVCFQPSELSGSEAVTTSFAMHYASAKSILVGLIGSGIQASRTPAMHEREGAEQGLRYIYKLIDLDILRLTRDALPELITAAQQTGFAGLNITYPCKQ